MSPSLRQLANLCMKGSRVIGPATRREWLSALESEYLAIDDDGDALSFAWGAFMMAGSLWIMRPAIARWSQRITLFVALGWAVALSYFTTIVIDPSLPINAFAHVDRSFTALDLQMPWQFALLYLSASLYLAIAYHLYQRNARNARPILGILLLVLMLKFTASFFVADPATIHLSMTLNVMILEVALFVTTLIGVWIASDDSIEPC